MTEIKEIYMWDICGYPEVFSQVDVILRRPLESFNSSYYLAKSPKYQLKIWNRVYIKYLIKKGVVAIIFNEYI